MLGILVRFASLFGCRCQTQHRLYRVHGEGLSQALLDRIDRVDRSTTKGVQYIVRLHSGARGGCGGTSNENQEEERKRKSLRGTTRKSRRGEEGGREEAVALRRVATSCTKGSDRTSYLTRACCASSVPTHLSPGPSSLISLFLTTIPSSSFLSFRVRRASAYSFPRPGARRRSNLCLSLSLLVWFVGSRLGTVITEYPPLTSGTLVVLSPPLAHLLLPPSP